ncbi:sodium/iodide co-transporter [Bacteroidia bacterium]|nr:sodium/iodide co-transporter [Bacteroidia bacterium]GHT81531.1 sodium/iodide co-transporter [Bacteroidia bacterium]
MYFSPYFVLTIIVAYFALLVVISWLTTRRLEVDSFYLGNRRNPWYVIAIGMIGSSISGITFISVPGMVGASQFSYLQMVAGFVVGYIVVAQVLLPLYYRLNLTSIYAYLGQRFGTGAYKTGASFFLISRLLGSAIRLLVVSVVLQTLVFDKLGIPFYINVIFTVLLIFVYTNKGGIKTIIWTDLLQTLVLLATLVLTIYGVASYLDLSWHGVVQTVWHSDLSRTLFLDNPADKRYFWKQFLAGAFTVITMTGLDQDLMQKNLSCKNLREAKRNMRCYGIVFLPVNLLFLSLGVLLLTFMNNNGITAPSHPDQIFPMIATSGYLPAVIGVFFVIGITAAAYSSADSALAALTTSFTIDILGLKNDDALLQTKRKIVHLGFSLLFIVLILLVRALDNGSLINTVYRVASYTYGPLLGLFSFGLFTKMQVRDRWVPLVALLAPVLSWLLNAISPHLFNGYQFGFELLIVNGLLTFIGLWCIRKPYERLARAD